ncbi:PilW family protein [Amphibacillus sediminis]|uniref:PilW family protein n=1 Tax=Amphibacillus sediminis TaxID=360185 RepID=UPI0008356041|nr:type II secretion system protein [Amphibacillus sediminis]
MVKDERGITLVELLGVLAIISVVITLIGSTHLFGQKQFIYQIDEIDKMAEVRQLMSQLTTDIRAVSAESISIDQDALAVGTNTYQFENQTVYRNGQVLSNEISTFDVVLLAEGIEVSIESTANLRHIESKLATTIYFRK